MSNLSNLEDHKEKLKLQVISQDLETVIYLLRLMKTGLQDYSIYTPVRNVYINIVENEKLLVRHLEKINEKLNKTYEKEN